MQKFRSPIQPELPDRAQGGGKQGEKQDAAAACPQQHKAPQLPLRLPQDKQEQRRPGGEAVQQIRRARQPGQPQPHGPAGGNHDPEQ